MKKIRNKNLLFFLCLLFVGGLLFVKSKDGAELISSVTSNFTVTITPAPQCSDGIDNDGDGFIDYPDDPDCTSPMDDSEFPDPPPPPPSGGGGGGGGGTVPVFQTGIKFSGRAYPLSKVTILRDGQIAIETIAGQDARFSATLGNLTPGNYNFTVRGTDENGLVSLPFSFPIFISDGSVVDVTGIFLAPTIDVSKIEVRRGDDIAIFGKTVPQSPVTIEVNSETQIFLAINSDTDGSYFYNFNSAPLEDGDHSTRSKTNLITGESSDFGRRAGFRVGNQNIDKVPGEKICNADLNADGRINLVDFSIAAFWYNKPLSGTIVEVEQNCLNGDGKINLVDFSILAFYWTG